MRHLALVAALVLVVPAASAEARTKTEAAALAKQVNLTKADMPGYKSSPTDPSQLSEDPKFVRCAKTVPASKAVGFFQSKTFERETPDGYHQTHSELDVLATPELVQKDIAAYATKRARTCMAKALKREAGRDLAKVTVSPMKPGVPNGTGIRIKTIVRLDGMRVPVHIDVMIVGHDDVEAVLVTTSGPGPVERDREDAWLQIVESRLEAALQPAPPVAESAMTRSQAAELARSVALQGSDLPDYNLTPGTNSSTEDIWGNGRVARCMGRRSFGKELADVASPVFMNPESETLEAIGSETEVMPSAAIVRKDLKLAGSARGRSCIAKELGFTRERRDAKLVRSSVTKLSPAVANGVGIRVRLVYRTRTRQTIVVASEILVFGEGPLEVALFGAGSPTVPDRALLDQLFATLRQRAHDQLTPTSA